MDYNLIPSILSAILRSTDVTKREICCKLDAVIIALGGSVTPYNSVSMNALTAGDVVLVPTSTAHSISFTVVTGTMTVEVNGVPSTYPTGYSGSMDFSTTNDQLIQFTADTPGTGFVTYTYA